MAEAKPFASLSSGLLARKGAARPAMRPQGFGQGASGLEDLGWNDMGFEPPKAAEPARDDTHDAFGDDVVEHPRAHPTGLTPVQSPVHHQQAEIADRLATEDNDEDPDETAEAFDPQDEEVPTAVSMPLVAAAPPAAPLVAAAPPAAPLVAAAPPAAPLVAAAPPAVPLVAAAPPAAPAVEGPAPVLSPRRMPRPRSAPGSKAKAAFTLRLDPERHLKLRLACAVGGRSAQQLVTDALDQLLGCMPELDSMAAKAKRKG